MKRSFKKFVAHFSLGLLLIGGLTATRLWADPFEDVTSDQKLYQRVKQLGDYGLLDQQDKAVLDEGKVVTRLELAFYVEKAKARITAPIAVPTSTPQIVVPSVESPSLPAPAAIAPKPTSTPHIVVPALEAPAIPPPAAPTVAPAPVMNQNAAKNEIEELLKELSQEAAMLRTRLSLDDQRLKDREDELEKLKAVQDDVDSAFKKANKSSGSPNFNTLSDLRFENIHVSGVTQVSATKAVNEVNLGVWSDLGGKGSISLGLGGYVSSDNASSSAVSIYLFSPKINWGMDGQLGHWDTNVAVEAYTADTDLGDFTRGNPLGSLRYEDPFGIKKYTTDKNTKNWDDYMTNLGYVPSVSSYISQSNTGIVFDGLYMTGTNLPLVSKDAKMTLLFGRMGRSNTNSSELHRWEEGLKYSQPWVSGFLQTTLATYWVNEDFGITPANTPSMDLKNYEADLGFDLKPLFLSLKGGMSHFYTGIEAGNPNPIPYEAPAGQASLSCYPFTVYYNAISDNYANIQSTAYLAGFNLNRFGYAYTNTDFYYGFVGMVDDLISDRHGWRANLGWKGRQENWTKFLPSFLDDVVINFDVASNTEYRMITDEVGHNVIETYNLITVLYPDDTGLWGSNIWGGYGGLHPMGTATATNIMNIRNDGFGISSVGSGTEYYFNMGNGFSTRVPFILPVYSSPGVIQTDSNGHNVYTNLDHLKTFNYVTLTAKLQFNKMFSMAEPFYGAFFYTNHGISGVTDSPTATMPDPNRPGQTLANVPNLFSQTVYDSALMYQVLKNVNLSADYGLEIWKSDYTYPAINWRTDSLGAGLAYDVPWGGGKLELRYKHLFYSDLSVAANSYQADQIYCYFLFHF